MANVPRPAALDDGPGVPPSAVHVNKTFDIASPGLSVLSLRFQVLDDRPDWPVVEVLVDGASPFADVAPLWHGFDPAEILGDQSPLLPVDTGRRVAVYRCSCGEACCGAMAPLIVSSADGRRVSWVAFGKYTGVFSGPLPDSAVNDQGRPCARPDIHFDRDQYVAEVQRASRDGSWETARRRTARLLAGRLERLHVIPPPELHFRWASPAWSDEGIVLMFDSLAPDQQAQSEQVLLRLLSEQADPVDAADDLARQLQATSPSEWVQRFGFEVA